MLVEACLVALRCIYNKRHRKKFGQVMFFLYFYEMERLKVNDEFVIVPLISALFLIFASCRQNYSTSDGEVWGTTYHIVYARDKSADAAIRSVLDSIDMELSMFNPCSNVSRVNAGLTDSVSESFVRVFDISRHVNRLSDGVYDPTIGPLCDLWGFGRVDVDSLPSEESIAEALLSVGIAECSVENGRIIKKNASTVFDFSSVAKGYGVDRVGRMFERAGITDYMIEIGGEVLARGNSPKGRPWRIQVDSPEGGLGHRRMAVLEIGPDARAVASSGNYRNYRSCADGKVYGHTISPVDGKPVDGSIAAVTVIAGSCAIADALATACMAAAVPERAFAILNAAGAEGAVVEACDDSLSVRCTPGFFAR